jgi:uncharacterized protein
VTDTAGFMSPQAARSLDARLEAYERQSGHQVLVWIGGTTGVVPLEDFTVRAFEAWKVGRQGLDDGLILFFFTEDRRVRIEVGYGLEGQMPDLLAGRIIEQFITPQLRAGNNDRAVNDGIEEIIRILDRGDGGSGAGQPVAEREARREERRMPLVNIVFYAVIGIVFLVLLITNPSLAIYILANILAGGGRRHGGGGFGGGGFGGGGGFRGGGGRSGGGGASGSW